MSLSGRFLTTRNNVNISRTLSPFLILHPFCLALSGDALPTCDKRDNPGNTAKRYAEPKRN